MRATLFLFFIIAGYCHLSAQSPGQLPIPPAHQPDQVKKNGSRILTEQCNNNSDEDGNGLRDCEDYSCYYSSNSNCNCAPIDVIWIGASNSGLYWINHVTGTEKFVGFMGRTMTDITWSPDGNLYGVDAIENKIWKIDPSNAQTTFVASLPGYQFSNALTTDGNGNFYLASIENSSNQVHIIRLDAISGAIAVIANLTASGLSSAGDVAFHNGALYVACSNNVLAKVNVITGAIVANPILGLNGNADIFGIVIKSDGTIYLSDINKLYRLNISSMQASLYYSCTTPMSIWGMASFNDFCLAPVCNARVDITIGTSQPFCSEPGVLLKANGIGLNNASYVWTLPGGNSVTSQNFTATKSGTYIVKYSTVPDTCSARDTVVLQITKTPAAKLGADTILCTGTSITFQPSDTDGITSFLWSNGSTGPQLTIDRPGAYWMQASNVCGTSGDTVIVTQGVMPDVLLGPRFEVCEYDTLHVKNLLDAPNYSYTWNDLSKSRSMIVSKPGKYWVNVQNSCGAVSDTIIIAKKIDDCECYLYMPSGFTPNGDGKNDYLKAFSNCLIAGELLVFNRWGQLMYQTNDLRNGWNGIYNNIRQASGVFVYHVKYTYKFRPGSFIKKGTFVLIR